MGATRDFETMHLVDRFFKKSNYGYSTITEQDFASAMTTLGLDDGMIYDQSELSSFFAALQNSSLQDPAMFVPNSSLPPLNRKEPSQTQVEIDFENFMIALGFLGRKPLSVMYQDILDRIYIASKQLDLHIMGGRVINLFQKEDNRKSGHVLQTDFISRLMTLIDESYHRGKLGTSKVGILEKDIRFLSTKYVVRQADAANLRVVSYIDFIEDYENIETMGISAGINELSLDDRVNAREIELRQKAYQQANLQDLPPESKAIYEKMKSYLKKKALEEELELQLVNANATRCGYLTSEQFKTALTKAGMPVNAKQIGLLTDCLQKEGKQKNYLQMIGLLFGKERAQRVEEDNSIRVNQNLGGTLGQSSNVAFDVNLLRLS